MSPAGFEFNNPTLAAVQQAPAFLDRDATIDIVARATAKAAANGADVVAFGEAFVPGFPTWALVLAPTDQHDLTSKLYHQAVEVPGPATAALARIAADNAVLLSVGVTERSTRSHGTMWNTNLVFGPDGALLNHRRKLVPTWAEKLIWSNGDAHDLTAVASPAGRIGALICGENTNPLARFALIDAGEQIHIAPYPPAWPTHRSANTTNYDLSHAITLRSSAHSFEGKLFTIAVSSLMSDAELAAIEAVDPRAAADVRAAPPPLSVIIGPDGRPLVEPLVAIEGTVLATVDLAEGPIAKKIHDVSGGYQRFDVFGFSVDRSRRDQGGPVDVR